jgi:hypothetical protein
MNQLGMTEEDLENDPSWVKAKVREANIDKVLSYTLCFRNGKLLLLTLLHLP